MDVYKFIKTNWFMIALLGLFVAAIARKNLRFDPDGAAMPPGKEHRIKSKQPEKYTDAALPSAAETKMSIGLHEQEAVAMPAIEEEVTLLFLQRFGKVTLGEQKKYGIPASVALACAYVNSFAGQRNLARESNNFFALPCSLDWEGAKISVKGHCYRAYDTPWESFRDFNIFLTNQDWYPDLKKSAGKDPLAWARGLDKAGVSDVENFGVAMEKVIRAYRLFELDTKK